MTSLYGLIRNALYFSGLVINWVHERNPEILQKDVLFCKWQLLYSVMETVTGTTGPTKTRHVTHLHKAVSFERTGD